jgi:hypothetical protein
VRILLATIAALTVISCSKDIQNSEAVKQSVLDYLRSNNQKIGLNLDAMTLDVTSVSYQKDQARAMVRFTPKGMPQGGMQFGYLLERKSNKWVVKGPLENGLNPHGAGGVPQEMPPGHPATGGAPGALPPGHPAVGSKQ